jgi:MerR family transcriptional regulator, light-induced transcriptional regulator
MYSIKQIENLTGIKAHTIRMWEQRYNFVEPKRTDTNIRYYDDGQMKKILNAALLISDGKKISSIAQMEDSAIYNEIDTIFSTTADSDLFTSSSINRLISASLVYDEVSFVKTFEDVIRRYGLQDAYVNVIYPLLVKVGMMWSKNEMFPSQEHFISNLLRQKLLTAIDDIDIEKAKGESWVLFLPENEHHEIGLLFCFYILRKFGEKVVYLGQNVPYENLKDAVVKANPENIYLFMVKYSKPQHNISYVDRLVEDFKDVKIHISGSSVIKENVSHVKNIHWVTEVDDLINNVLNKGGANV